MRRQIIAITMCLSASALSSLGAQVARSGRLPVLETPPATGGTCRRDSATADLRSMGIVRLIAFSMADSSSHRLQSVGVDRNGAPVFLMAMMGTRRARRGESESIGVFFDTSGRVVRGNRNAFTTGVPTHLSDDRNGLRLQATDTAAALALARTLRIRCGE